MKKKKIKYQKRKKEEITFSNYMKQMKGEKIKRYYIGYILLKKLLI